jgi:hypothetical protein
MVVSRELVEVGMWKPWEWARRSNHRAVDIARSASVALSRGRVERADVDLFLAEHAVSPVVRPAATHWPA